MGNAHDAPTAFCHHTHTDTQGRQLVCDIQGVTTTAMTLGGARACGGASRNDAEANKHYILTDPQIHTREPTTDFGIGNCGQEGMRHFFAGHECGPSCAALNLVNPYFDEPERQRIVADKVAVYTAKMAAMRRTFGHLLMIIVGVWVAYTCSCAVYNNSVDNAADASSSSPGEAPHEL